MHRSPTVRLPRRFALSLSFFLALPSSLAANEAAAPPSGAAAGAAPRADEVARTIHVPPGWEGAYEFGYAPVIRVGSTVIVSGIPAGGSGTYEEKIRRMYQRASELLAEAGATVDDVVELTTFHREPKDTAAFSAEFDRYMPIHREFFRDHRPAWTAVGTTALLSPTAPVEMRVMAVVGSGKASRVVRGRALPPPPAESPSAAPPASPPAPSASRDAQGAGVRR